VSEGTGTEVDAGWVIVVGSINVDLTVQVEHLPRPGETVANGILSRAGGGKSANQACAAARFGAHARFVGAVGDDEMAEQALTSLEVEGIDVSGVAHLAGTPTAVALIMVDPRGENQIAVASGASGVLDGPTVRHALAAIDPPAGSVVLTGFEVADGPVVAAAEWAAEHDLTLVVNPGPARPLLPELLAARPILTPNETEARQLTGEHDPERAAAVLMALTGAPVVVTLGAAGALVLEPGHDTVEVARAPMVETIDTTGAGDTLSGVLAACLAAGAPIRGALSWAVTAAALSTTGVGARGVLPDRAEVGLLMGMVTG
jgi:ribokinase